MYHLLLVVHMWLARQPTITSVALCHKNVGGSRCKIYIATTGHYNLEAVCPWVSRFLINFTQETERMNTDSLSVSHICLAAASTLHVFHCHKFSFVFSLSLCSHFVLVLDQKGV